MTLKQKLEHVATCVDCGSAFYRRRCTQVRCPTCQQEYARFMTIARSARRQGTYRMLSERRKEMELRGERLARRDEGYSALAVPVKIIYRNGMRIERRGNCPIASRN